MKKIILQVISKFGYSLSKIKDEFNDEQLLLNDKTLLTIIKQNTMLPYKRLLNIKKVVEYIVFNNIPGDFVECGIWKGGSIAYAAKCLMDLNKYPSMHLFDSFDDICEPDSKVDGERAIKEVGGLEFAQGRLKPVKGIYETLVSGGPGNELEVLNLLTKEIGYPNEKINIHKGYFQDKLPEVQNKLNNIAYLRLDGDWYASTKVCLDYLFDKVVKGGVIIIDDYGTYEGCKLAVDEFLLSRNLCPFLFEVDSDCIFWIKM